MWNDRYLIKPFYLIKTRNLIRTKFNLYAFTCKTDTTCCKYVRSLSTHRRNSCRNNNASPGLCRFCFWRLETTFAPLLDRLCLSGLLSGALPTGSSFRKIRGRRKEQNIGVLLLSLQCEWMFPTIYIYSVQDGRKNNYKTSLIVFNAVLKRRVRWKCFLLPCWLIPYIKW